MMLRTPIVHRLLACALASAIGAAAAASWAGEGAEIEFRRAYVPANRIADFAGSGPKYVPVSPEEFERLATLAQNVAAGLAPETARLTEAEYDVAATAAGSLAGTARLSIAHTGAEECWLCLDPCNVTVGEARWADEPSRQARLAMDARGRLIVLVNQPGTLELSWSLAPREAAVDRFSGRVELPRAALNRLWLTLPAGVEPALSRGVVTPPGADEPRWLCELGGHNTFDLRLVPAGARVADEPALRVRRALAYQLSAQGMELTATLNLEVDDDSVKDLLIEAARPLRIVGVKYRDETLPLTVLSANDAATQRALVTFREPLPETAVVQVIAVAPLDMGARFELPQIRVPQAVDAPASLVLTAPAPLVIEQLVTRQCRQSEMLATAGNQAGETFAFESVPSGGGVELVVGRLRERLSGDLAIDVELGESASARAAALVRASEGERFRLSGEILAGWTVDSVATVPADALANWRVESDDAGRSLLEVRLNSAITPQRAVQLIVTGKRPGVTGEQTWAVEQLRWLRLENITWRGEWLRVHAQPPHELNRETIADDSLVPLEELDDDVRALFDAQGVGPIAVMGALAPEARFVLTRQEPQVSADCRVTLLGDPNAWREELAIQCRPAAAALKKVRIRTSPPRDMPWQWTTDLGLHAQKLPPEIDGAGQPQPWETWELTFDEPLAAAFELHAVRVVPSAGAVPVTLAAVVDAVEQTGRLELGVAAGGALQIRNARLPAVPAALPAPGRPFSVQAAFDYRPQTDLAAASGPPMTVAVTEDAAGTQDGLHAWHTRLTTRLNPGGVSSHTIEYRLENPHGQRQLAIDLPSHLTVHNVTVDGHPVPRTRTVSGLDIDLPADVRFPSVVMQLSSREAAGGAWGRYAPAWPTIHATPGPRELVLYLPEGYDASASPNGAQPVTIRRRLFGPLAPLGEAVQAAPSSLMSLNADSGPWRPWEDDGAEEAQAGWRAHRATLVGDGNVEFALTHRPTVVGLAWAALLIALGVGALLRARPLALLVLTGAVSCVSLLAPAELVAVTGYASLGCLASWLALLMPEPAPVERQTARHSSLRRAATASSAVLVLAVLWFATGDAVRGAAPPAENAQAAAVEVLIPVDENREPTGDFYQVPEPLYLALLRVAALTHGLSEPWLIESATYEASRPVAAGEGGPGWSLKLVLDLNVVRGGVTVSVPLPHGLTNDDLQTARLNGRPLVIRWDADSNLASFDVAMAERQRFEISLSSTLAARGLDPPELAVSPLALARLRLSNGVNKPPGAGALGGDPGSALIALGPTNVLRFDAPLAGLAQAQPAGEVEVEQLVWLKPQANSTVANVRCKYRIPKGSVRSLAWTVDPSLRLVPLTGVNSSLARSRISRGELYLELARPATDQLTVDLTFILSDAGQTGVLTWPRLEPIGARLSDRRVAVTLGAGLQAAGPVATGFVETPVDEFLSRWGGGGVSPDLTFLATAPAASWSLPIDARRPTSTTVDELTLSVGRIEGRFRWRSVFDPPSDLPLQVRAQILREMKVSRVSLRAGEAEQVWRWSLSDEGLLTVFLTEPLAGQGTLVVEGEMSCTVPGTLSVGAWQLERVQAARRRVFVYRQPDTLVKVANSEGLSDAAESSSWDVPPRWGRLALALSGSPAATATLDLQPNAPEVQLDTLTEMSRDEATWTARVVGAVRVSGGVADRLRFAVPADWAGPFEVVPAGSVKLVAGQGGDRAVLEFEPTTPIAGEARFVLSGPLRQTPGRGVETPSIEPLHVAGGERFICLPPASGGDPLHWELRGLVEAELPASLARDGEGTGRTCYRVVETAFAASLQSAPARLGVPQCGVAEVRIVDRQGANALGLASFDIEPAGASSCLLAVPEGCEVLAVRVADLPAVVETRARGRLLIALASSSLPQRLEVAVRIARGSPAGDGLWRYPAPTLVDLAVRKTIWNVQGQDGSTRAPGASNDLLSIQMLRLQELTRLLEQGGDLSSGQTAGEIECWYAPWIRRWMVARQDVEQTLRRGRQTELTRETAAEVQLIVDEQTRLAAKLGVEPTFRRALVGPLDAIDLADIVRGDSTGASLSGVRDGAATQIEVRASRAAWPATLGRGALAAFIAIVVGWCLWGGGAYLVELLRRWPAAACALVGMGWWVWLTPAWVGALLVALALLRSWRAVPLDRPGPASTITHRQAAPVG